MLLDFDDWLERLALFRRLLSDRYDFDGFADRAELAGLDDLGLFTDLGLLTVLGLLTALGLLVARLPDDLGLFVERAGALYCLEDCCLVADRRGVVERGDRVGRAEVERLVADAGELLRDVADRVVFSP